MLVPVEKEARERVVQIKCEEYLKSRSAAAHPEKKKEKMTRRVEDQKKKTRARNKRQ